MGDENLEMRGSMGFNNGRPTPPPKDDTGLGTVAPLPGTAAKPTPPKEEEK